MKKVICILLVSIILCGLVACDTNTQTEENATENKDYSAAISSLEKAMENIHGCAAIQQDWLDASFLLVQLYDDVNYTSGYNKQIDAAGKNCYNYRKTARSELNNAKDILKGGSGELHDAVQEYYLAVSAAMDFVSNFPEGYSQFTWNQKWTELEGNASSAANKVKLYM